MWKYIINFVPGVLSIPLGICALLYAIFLPETFYYLLGIYFNMWFPILTTFWGYPLLFILLMVPVVSAVLMFLFVLQSFHVLFKFIFGMYDPSFHGFVTMYPAATVLLVLIVSRFVKD